MGKRYFDRRRVATTSNRKKEPTGLLESRPAVHYHIQDGGAVFGSWVDEGTRNNGFNANDVIECPPYLIEDFLRRLLTQGTEKIDWESADLIGNTTDGLIKDWKMFGAIAEIEPALVVLDRLCAQSKTRLFRDADGKFSFWCHDIDQAADYTDYSFGPQLHLSNLNVYRTPRSGIANTVRINYMLNRGSGSYQKQTFIEVTKTFSGSLVAEDIDASETSWLVDDYTDFAVNDVILIDNEVCTVSAAASNPITVARAQYNSTAATHDDNAPIFILETDSDDGTGSQDQNAASPNDREDDAIESVWRYGVVDEFVLDCDFIIDDTTAQELREHYFDFLKAPKWTVEFDTYLNAANLKVNQIITFNSTELDAYMKLGNTSWSGLKFVVTNIDRKDELNFHVVCEQLTYGFI